MPLGPRLSRRRLLLAGGGGAAGLIVGGGGFALGRDGADGGSAAPAETVGIEPFYAPHQAGIATAAQERLMFAAFDLTLTRADELRDLLRTWTIAAAAMTSGNPIGSVEGPLDAPAVDTGEAVDLHPSRLTLTFGLGASVFLADGKDRFGLAARQPKALRPLGPLPGDELDADRSDGDLCVQACANDPQVAFHAIRALARVGRGAVVLRWTQLGFGRTSTTSRTQATARNLFGFRDGTNNIRGEDAVLMDGHVWVGDDEPQAWLRGGSYAVTRRIRMLIETWDRSSLGDQETTIGRSKLSGAPLGGTKEDDPVDLTAKGADGVQLIDDRAHIHVAAPSVNDDIRILRRGYSFTDGTDPETGQLDAGLFFIAYQKDPSQFLALQRRLGTTDKLNEYIKHTSSGLFAIPGGIPAGGYLAQGLFA